MAGGAVVGALRVTLGINTAAFEKGLSAAQKNLGKVSDRFTSVGKTLTAGLTLPLAAFGATAVKEAQEAAHAMGQVEAALNSMGPAAGRTAEQLKAASDGLEMQSLYEGDQILTKVTANLLTFGNISGAVFDRAQQAIVDVATRMNIDLQSATLLVGKALNSPLKGMSALGKAGIQFTEAQKAQIKAMAEAGNVAGAQSIILKELARQYGGAAQAAQNADPWNKVKDAFNSVAESVGKSLLVILPPLADALASVASAFNGLSPETQKWLVIAGGVLAVVGPIALGIGGIVSVIGAALPAIVTVGGALATMGTILTGAVLPALGGLLVALSPILVPLAAVAAAVGAVYLAWKNWDTIGPILQRLWAIVKTAVVEGVTRAIETSKAAVLAYVGFWANVGQTIARAGQMIYTGVKTWVLDKLNQVWDWAIQKIESVKKTFWSLYNAVVGNSYIPDMINEIGVHMARLKTVLVNPSKETMEEAEKIFKDGADAIRQEMATVFSQDSLINVPAAPSGEVDSGSINEEAGEYGRVIVEKVLNPSEDVTKRSAEAFADMARDISDSLSGLAGSIRGGDFFDIFSAVIDVLATVGRAIGGFDLGPLKFPGASGGTGGYGGYPGFARGGSFKVGGRGGIDRNLIAFRATRGEMVDIRRPGQDRGAGGQVFDMRGAIVTSELLADINSRIAAGEARAVTGGASLALNRLAGARRRALA